jgi:predicted enzyme related to lactoylglutathione lyase
MSSDTITSLYERASALGAERLASLAPGMQVEPTQLPWAPADAGQAFATGTCWTQCTFYTVDDFATEVGFYADVLGLKTFMIAQSEAMFTSSSNEYYIGVRAADEEHTPAAPNSVRVQFMVENIEKVVEELERRGIVYESRPEPTDEGSPMWFGTLRSPHGVRVDLWGMIEE